MVNQVLENANSKSLPCLWWIEIGVWNVLKGADRTVTTLLSSSIISMKRRVGRLRSS